MARLDYRVFVLVDEALFFLSEIAPQQERTTAILLRNEFDHSVGEMVPADFRVRGRFVRLDSQKRVEHENALIGPFLETPSKALVSFKSRNIVFQLGEYVSKRWWQWDPFGDRE